MVKIQLIVQIWAWQKKQEKKEEIVEAKGNQSIEKWFLSIYCTMSTISATTSDTTQSSSSYGSEGFTPFSVNPSHPFYIHPSDNPNNPLVSPPFDGRGFVAWRRNMFVALFAKNKLGIETEIIFSESSIHTSVPFQLVHIDIRGPYHIKTYNDFRYFLTLVDDYSRVTWTHLLSCKSNALSVLQDFVSMVKVHFQSHVKAFRSDNAFELGGSSECQQFFSANGILHQTSIPHTPQQNGVVERKHKFLLEVFRALLFQSNLLLKYWGDCVLTTTYLINRLPSTILHNSSPFEKFHGHSPSLSHLRCFECLCHASSPIHSRDKFQSRFIFAVFIGYPCGKNGYKLLNLQNHSIFYSRDVIFHDHVFPYQPPASNPSSSPFVDISPPSATSQPISAHSSSPSPPLDIPLIPTLTHASSSFLSSLSPSQSTPSQIIFPAPQPPSFSSPPVPSPSPPQQPAPLILRKSFRPTTTPSYISDYVCSSIQSTPVFPSAKAASQPAWKAAMLKEFEDLDANHTWDMVLIPFHKKAIPCKWVYRSNKDLMASRQWFSKLFEALARGYISNKNDYTLFSKPSNGSLVVLDMYVNDILLAGNDLSAMNGLKEFLDAQFKIKDLGTIHYFLGLEITQHPDE
ncbi:uncharacterized protein LOC142162416 [Nicotiana tabacum]|uniref:Uncharacterized protein LOC142162416 n=1 Tax=Nicotiana tabacum TaxID=4097 RepID=A0AC58RQ73_TOBAC